MDSARGRRKYGESKLPVAPAAGAEPGGGVEAMGESQERGGSRGARPSLDRIPDPSGLAGSFGSFALAPASHADLLRSGVSPKHVDLGLSPYAGAAFNSSSERGTKVFTAFAPFGDSMTVTKTASGYTIR